MPFCLSFFAILLLILCLQFRIYFISTVLMLNVEIVIIFLITFLLLKKSRSENILIIIKKYSLIVFLTTLSACVLINLKCFNNSLTWLYTSYILTTISLCTGFITVYANNKTRGNQQEAKSDKNKSLKAERKFFFSKKSIFSVLLIFVCALFIAIKIIVILSHNGNYIDEYFQIGSGMQLLKTGELATFYYGLPYKRGLIVSCLSAISIHFFEGNSLALKTIPALFGLFNFTIVLLILYKIKIKKFFILITLFIYSISPWVIFNDYYLRSYVLNEFFTLLSILIFINIINKKQINARDCIYLVAIISINALTDFGSGLNLLLFIYVIFALFYILVIKTNKMALFYISIFLIATLAALYIVKTSSISYGATTNYSYLFFFFLTNAPLTVFFLLSPFIFRKHNSTTFLALSALTIFTFNLLLPSDFQIIRGVLYFLPLYYIVLILTLSELNFNKYYELAVIIIIITCIWQSYPPSFLKNPYIPNEINYIDNSIFKDAKSMCQNSLIITSSRPRMLLFFGVKPDYQINTQLSDQNWINNSAESSMYFKLNNRYYDADTKTPVITNIQDFINITNDRDTCLIMGGLPSSWVDKYINIYISEYFQEYNKKYLSNYDYRRMRLFFK